MMQPCWTCQNCYGGCNWSARFEPVEGWIATPRTYGQIICGIQSMESYEILYCPEYVNDGSDQRNLTAMILVLREQGLSFGRIGQMVGLTAQAVRGRYCRAKEGGK